MAAVLLQVIQTVCRSSSKANLFDSAKTYELYIVDKKILYSPPQGQDVLPTKLQM